MPAPQIPILFIDDALLVANKPAGLPTLVDGYHPDAPYLAGALKQEYGRLWTVHRLDRETSGVIAFARTASAHRSLNAQFAERQARKVYHALVAGDPDWSEQRVDLPLRPDGDRRHRTLVDPQRGKPSETGLRVLERFGAFSLVEAVPRTGRTHQVRAHLAALGHPLVGDDLYGSAQPQVASILHPEPQPQGSGPSLARVGLHAWSLALAHPATGAPLEFQAGYPGDFERALEALRRTAR